MSTRSGVSINSVHFTNYKALGDFSVTLSRMNILVGANNNGKSTVLGAFRVLAQALRIAKSKTPEILWGPKTQRPCWRIPEDSLPVSSENIHTEYDEVHSFIEFRLSNGTTLTLFFPDEGGCKFYGDSKTGYLRSAGDVRKHAPIELAVVPILGPLEHEEPLVAEETVRRNLLTTRASRHFRNYWYYYKEGFDDFAAMVRRTWPGMDITPPERSGKTILMFCQEHRRDRELFWSGFGFQIWLQLLAHVVRSDGASVLVVDEPELYLHPDVQLQLLSLLRQAGPDILVATHSTELMSEADPTEILLVDKTKKSAERLRDVEGIQRALDTVGSVQNLTLSRLARNKRILFAEGSSDFRLLRRFAERLSFHELAAGTDLTQMESGGFSAWDHIRGLAAAFEEALGFKLQVGAVFDRDYWCDEQLADIQQELDRHLQFAHIHQRKEVENYLLEPTVLDRALAQALRERSNRTGDLLQATVEASEILDEICAPMRNDIQSQFITKRQKYFEKSGLDPSTVTKVAMDVFESRWSRLDGRLALVSGKKVLRALRDRIAADFRVSLTDARIVSCFRVDEIPPDLAALVEQLDRFRQSH